MYYLIGQHPFEIPFLDIVNRLPKHGLPNHLLFLQRKRITIHNNRLLDLFFLLFQRYDLIVSIIFLFLSEVLNIFLRIQYFHLLADIQEIVFYIFEHADFCDD